MSIQPSFPSAPPSHVGPIAFERWTALIPLKGGSDRKTRLAAYLSAAQRHHLASAMFRHVGRVLSKCRGVDDVVLLSSAHEEAWVGRHIADLGRGLNVELVAAVEILPASPLLVIHADLPLLTVADVEALLAAGTRTGCAIAPDRVGTGTNAIALRDPHGFHFQFGPGSFELHALGRNPRPEILCRRGLSQDIDTWDDLGMLLDHRGRSNPSDAFGNISMGTVNSAPSA